MPDYSFLNLSPAEFEDLSRDLLQKEFDITLESFADGKDGGIDLRYSKSENDTLIIQCKRYSSYSNLKSNLKKECAKVKILKPKRYVLVTSVGLTPLQKSEIQMLLMPYLQHQSDIYGKSDLNNLLSKFPEVEREHFKLWLSSTTILNRIVNSRVYNQSNFEEDEIKRTVKLYVSNESYNRALSLVDKHKFVIISGTPGIGKTTLARVLSYNFLASGYEDFVFLSGSIDEAYSLYQPDKKQVFLFDDFLGKTFLHPKLGRNEDQQIFRFIEKISKSDNKVLILTTREYILSQAKNTYEIFNEKMLNMAKCIIDLEKYTKLVRAKILYNHIFFSNVEKPYIDRLLAEANYKRIINHKNYSPRIIETVIQNLDDISPDKFIERFIGFLDYPESIWKHVYECQITPLSQVIMANLLTAGTPILWNDLQILIKSFSDNYATKYGFYYSEIDYQKAVKELENTFIRTFRDDRGQIIIEYANPSVQDFLITYLNGLQDMVGDIIDSSIFYNQLFSYFNLDKDKLKIKSARRTHINLTPYLSKKILNKIVREFGTLQNSELIKCGVWQSAQFYYQAEKWSVYRKLDYLLDSDIIKVAPEIREFAKDIFEEFLFPTYLNGEDVGRYIKLISNSVGIISFDESAIMEAVSGNIESLNDYNDFKQFEALFPTNYRVFIQTNPTYKDSIQNLISWEAENIDTQDIPDLISNIHLISEHTGIDLSSEIYGLEERYDDRYCTWDPEENHDSADDGFKWSSRDEDADIANMFDSLR